MRDGRCPGQAPRRVSVLPAKPFWRYQIDMAGHQFLRLAEYETEGADVLARYEHPHLGTFPAVTTHAYGRGRVTYVGTLPDPGLGRAIADRVLVEAGVRTARSELVGTGGALPESVRVTRARSTDGRRLWFVTNWSDDGADVAVDAALGLDTVIGPDNDSGTVRLGGWDLAVLVDEVRA